MDQFQLPGGVASDLLDWPWPRFLSPSHEKNDSCYSLLPKAIGRSTPNKTRRGKDKWKYDAGTYNLCFELVPSGGGRFQGPSMTGPDPTSPRPNLTCPQSPPAHPSQWVGDWDVHQTPKQTLTSTLLYKCPDFEMRGRGCLLPPHNLAVQSPQ